MKKISKTTKPRGAESRHFQPRGAVDHLPTEEERFDQRVSSAKSVDDILEAVRLDVMKGNATLAEWRRFSASTAAKWDAVRSEIEKRLDRLTVEDAKTLARDLFFFGEDLEPAREALFVARWKLSFPLEAFVSQRGDRMTWKLIAAAVREWKEPFRAFGSSAVMKAGRETAENQNGVTLTLNVTAEHFLDSLDCLSAKLPGVAAEAASMASAFSRYVERCRANVDADLLSAFNDLEDKLAGLVAAVENADPGASKRPPRTSRSYPADLDDFFASVRDALIADNGEEYFKLRGVISDAIDFKFRTFPDVVIKYGNAGKVSQEKIRELVGYFKLYREEKFPNECRKNRKK